MKCSKISRLMTDMLAGELSAIQAKQLEEHLAACENCRREFDELREIWNFTGDTLRQNTQDLKLSDARRKEIFEAAAELPAMKLTKKMPSKFRWMELAATLIIGFFVLSALLLPALNSAREKARRIACASDLKQVGLSLKQFARDSADRFPSNEQNNDKDQVISATRTPKILSFGAADGALPAAAAPAEAESSAAPHVAAEAAPAAVESRGLPDIVESDSAPAIFEGIKAHKDADRGVVSNEVKVGAERRGKGGATGNADAVNQKESSDGYLRKAGSGPSGSQGLQVLEEKPVMRDEKSRAAAAAPPIPPSAPVKSELVAAKRALTKSKDNLPVRPAAPAAKPAGYAYAVAATDKKDRAESKQASSPQVLYLKSPAEPRGEDAALAQPSLAAANSIQESEAIQQKEQQLAMGAFSINLKLWNLTTVEDVRDFLKSRNCPVPAIINIYVDKECSIVFKAPADVIARVEDIFEPLENEERRMRWLHDGLPFIKAEFRPFSTFSIDTDTASYLAAKKNINRGIRPDPTKIRAEDFINYFDYHYRSPENGVFAVNMESAPAPFRPQNTLLRIGVQGKRLGPNMNSASVYTVLLDTSGSMAYGERMDLAINALKLLSAKMTPYDRLSLVICGGTANVLINNQMKNKNTLDTAVKAIAAGGVSDFFNGLQKAYQLAAANYRAGAWNRVVIITDGIVKLEPDARAEVIKNIEKNRINGISNIVIGLGGDGDDKLLEEIASTGDGSYVFVDSENDVKELFSASFEARFREIARDVKIQVEFNPENVAEYRQIGYENRQLSKADFLNDSVDAGEVGSGQSVTALYELRLKPGVKPDATVATTRIRYKNAEDMHVEEKSFVIDAGSIGKNFEAATPGFKLASFAAEFAEGLEYPETQNIATPSGIAVKLRQVYISNYAKDEKVRELLDLISRVR